VRVQKIISLCLAFGLLICSFAQSQTKNEQSIKNLISYLDLKNVSEEEVTHLTDLKDKAESPGLTTDQRKAAYHDLFAEIAKVQGSTAPPQVTDFYTSAAMNWYCEEPRVEKKEIARPGDRKSVV